MNLVKGPKIVPTKSGKIRKLLQQFKHYRPKKWWWFYYHLFSPHESSAVSIPSLRNYRQRSPPRTAYLISKLWTVDEVLKLPLTPVSM